MPQPHRIAVVTGANRGIGLEIARELAQAGLRVVGTARDDAKCAAIREELDGLPVATQTLDVRDEKFIMQLARTIHAEYGRVDVLVNNAGVLLDPKGSRALGVELDLLRETMETNIYGPLRLAQALVPLMRRGAYGRIVNVSSGLGQLKDMGVGSPAYRISKTCLNALTRMLAAELEADNIKVNSMCPGWVRTRMGGTHATRSVEEAADTAVWLAMLPDDGPSGGFFRDRQPIPW